MSLDDFREHEDLFTVERGGDAFPLTGIRPQKDRVFFDAGADVRVGDWLVVGQSGKRLYVRDTDMQRGLEAHEPHIVIAYVQTEAERRDVKREQQPTQNFIFNAPSTGMYGSQQNFTFHQVVRDLDRQIEEHGGEDKEELAEMLAEIEEALESQDSISRGKFVRWSELANKHAPWLLGPLGSLAVNYMFRASGG